MHLLYCTTQSAGVAQLVEQLIRNQEVSGSIPLSGTISCLKSKHQIKN